MAGEHAGELGAIADAARTGAFRAEVTLVTALGRRCS
jgi:hypothetical protein